MARARNKKNTSGIGIKGLFRVRISEIDGTVIGETPWKKNIVTKSGVEAILSRAAGVTAGSINAAYLGTGAAVAYSDAVLPSLIADQNDLYIGLTTSLLTSAASSDSATLRFALQFDPGWSTALTTIGSIGMYNNVYDLCAANTFASSVCDTDQIVQATYNILLKNTP